jgi:outer membrane immunogenic protein
VKGPLIGLLALGAFGAALADDGAAHDWSGPYAGAQIGYAFADTSSFTTNLVGTFPVPFDYESDGVLGGGHAGYNLQFGQVVLGIEGDIEAADISDRQDVFLYNVTYSSETTSDFAASIRARAGFTFDRLLIYGTAGVAWGRVKIAYSCDVCVVEAGATSTLDDTRSGWTAGGGVEYSLTPDISMRLDYRHTDLGSTRLIDVEQVADYHGNNFSYDAVRFGLSYGFSR